MPVPLPPPVTAMASFGLTSLRLGPGLSDVDEGIGTFVLQDLAVARTGAHEV